MAEKIDSPTRQEGAIVESTQPKTAPDTPLAPQPWKSKLQSVTSSSYFDALPAEIISIIVDCLEEDIDALKALRTVNKSCSFACTRLLFRRKNILIDKENIAHLHGILGNPLLRSVTTSVVIDTARYTDRHFETFDWDDRDKDLLKRFNHYLTRVGRFCSLKDVHLRFSKACVGPPLRRHWWASQVPEDVSFRTNALQSLFKGLNDTVNRTPRFRKLVLENLQDWTDESLVKSEDFQTVMTRIRCLELQITIEEDEFKLLTMDFLEKKELHDFFYCRLHRDWLAPCAANLTHLKLYARTVYWGYIPRCSFPHFPNLQSLSLGKMTFAHDSQLNWITSHSATLEELTLDDCPIIIGTAWYGTLDEDGYPTDATKPQSSDNQSTRYYSSRWHSYFRTFRLQLLQLRSLRCGFNDEDWEREVAFNQSHTLGPRLWPERYRVFDTCWLERPPFVPEEGAERGAYNGSWENVPCYPDCTDEDLLELVRLREVLSERTGIVDDELAILRGILD